MRTLHLDSGRTWRGGQGQALLLLRGLGARGHDVLLLAPEGPLLEKSRAAGIETRVWPARGEWDVASLLGARAAIGAFRAEMVHGHSARAHALGVPAANLERVPVVVSRRVDFGVAGNPLSALKYRMGVERYLCISRGVMDVMRSAGIPETRLALVPSGVELPDLAAVRAARAGARTLRETLGLPEGAPVVGTVAALAPHKNHADLMRAAAIVRRTRPDVRFAWAGEGECRPALERQRRELGLEDTVHLLGFRADVHALISQFTLFALSSYLEGLCTSLLDAQALGIPIVATAVGGIPDVIEDGRNGRLVPGRDPAAFAAAVLEALASPDRAAAWAAAGRESVRSFTADAMVTNTLRVYDDVLRERAARTRGSRV